MIKTTIPVSYDLINPSLQEVVKAKIATSVRNDENETYSLNIEEWVEIPYTEMVPDENGDLVQGNFIKKVGIRNHVRVMTFVEADALTNALDQMYSITETGAYRRKKYTELGHLLINNLEQVRGVSWELV
jgi:hypothetical protein